MKDLRALIQGKSPTEIEHIISQFLMQEIARILCTAPERITPSKSLHDLGMDSLMAVELSLGLERALGVQLPAMALNDSPTIQALSARLTKLVVGDNEGEAPDSTGAVVANAELLIQEHGEELSADELQKLGLAPKDTTA
jgi:acyl carrier protein